MEHTVMSSYTKTMAEALQEVSDKNILKVNELDEGRMSEIHAMVKDGKTHKQIANLYYLLIQ